MRYFFQEHQFEYQQYAFGYRVFVEREPDDDLHALYAQGFLPYSGDPGDPRDIFYMARSGRIALKDFSFRKKRRYEQRNGDHYRISVQGLTIENLLKEFPSDQLFDVTEDWMTLRFGQPYLSRDRIRYILNKDFLNRAFVFSYQDDPCAIVLACDFFPSLHYWYAFYDPQRIPDISLGAWCMGKIITHCRDSRYESVYLGTLYGTSSYYKLKGIHGSQFWTGSHWSTEMQDLKARLAEDEK